jgi:hypothetical protein
MKSLTLLVLLSTAAPAAAQPRGAVTGVRLSDTQIVAGTPVTMTITGSNPCGAVYIDPRDGSAQTHPIERVPTNLSHTYARPGTYRIIARGSGNCDGEALATITVLPRRAGQTGQDQARFRGMDRDNDGVITRSEWRGSERGFRDNDWDNDGVLSGAEVGDTDTRRGAIDRTPAQMMASFDTNGDNRISLSEWRGSRRSFAVRDANGDGLLSRRELAIVANADNNPQPIGTSGQAVVVRAGERWTDTGLFVRQGDVVAFDADGSIRLSGDPNDTSTPAGAPAGRLAGEAAFPQQPAGALIARIGNSPPLFVGGRNSLVSRYTGRLFLGVNDDHLPDNAGEYRVRVGVNR